jgi:hypothetical protein
MKIFVKTTHFCMNEQDERSEKILIAAICFNSPSVGNILLFENIHFKDITPTEGQRPYFWFDDELGSNVNTYAYVLYSDENKLIISTANHSEFNANLRINIDELSYLISANRLDVVPEFLEEIDTPCHNSDADNYNLPSLSEYIRSNPSEFNIIYYPGAGNDFSPMHIFGINGKPSEMYFVDFFTNSSEINQIKENIDRLGQNIEILSPAYFNKNTWLDFWPPSAIDNEAQISNPEKSWGRKAVIQTNDTATPFSMIYLAAEGVKTASVLLENNIFPDVVVLQNHYGVFNFGGENSELYHAMKNHLPKYLLAQTDNELSMVWPGYEQVTHEGFPEIYHSLPQHGNKRALFKQKE